MAPYQPKTPQEADLMLNPTFLDAIGIAEAAAKALQARREAAA